MLQIPIQHHLSEADKLYRYRNSEEVILHALRKGIFEITKVVVKNARKFTGIHNINFRLVEDFEGDYYGAYNFGDEVDPFIKLNMAPLLVKAFELFRTATSPDEVERQLFSRLMFTSLHELGHHNEAINIPTHQQDLENLEQGGLAINHIYQLDKSGELTHSAQLLEDDVFLGILTDSKQYIVESERTADRFAVDTLNKYQMTDVITYIQADGFDIKNGYYYRLYSDRFLANLLQQTFNIYFADEQSTFKSFLGKIVYETDEIVLSRLRAEKRKQLQY